jgi:hypothetical protein
MTNDKAQNSKRICFVICLPADLLWQAGILEFEIIF